MHRHSTADNYATALRSLLAFHGKKDISFAEVDSRLVDAYGEWLRRKGICKDTLSCYMRSLRAVYNKAVEQGLTEQKEPFGNVSTGISRTRKRSIEKADINKLRAVQVKPGSFMQLVRDVFLFCFYACGMPFVDVAFLKKSQIKGGMLVYHRRKTDQVVFSYYNKTLKTLGKLAGVDKPLSSYVARHTWATLAFMSSVDMSVIAQALGHTDVKTTRIYVEDIGNGKQNSANKKLLDEVLRKRSSVQEVTSVQE